MEGDVLAPAAVPAMSRDLAIVVDTAWSCRRIRRIRDRKQGNVPVRVPHESTRIREGRSGSNSYNKAGIINSKRTSYRRLGLGIESYVSLRHRRRSQGENADHQR